MAFDIPQSRPDPLWQLSAACQADPRPEKLDLIIGVYRDDHGQTPILKTVHQAEQILAANGASKAYRGLSGHRAFNAGMAQLLLGQDAPRRTDLAVIQSIGGTGALRLLGDLIARAQPGATLWSPDPGYINHHPIFAQSGLSLRSYRLRPHAGLVDAGQICRDLEAARPGDVLLLHGCCHNPTGLEMALDGWAAMADLCADKGLIPLIDMAYQGFGQGLETDAAGLRLLAARLDKVLIAASCSKNMGLYCERVGAALVLCDTQQAAQQAEGALQNIARSTYSMPPDHGAAVATLVLENRTRWQTELDAMRHRIIALRQGLADRLAHHGAPEPLLALRTHRGMFSTLPFSPAQMAHLRKTYAIYGTDSGRINIAGLSAQALDPVAQALVHSYDPCRPR